jgi:hypothetical protein
MSKNLFCWCFSSEIGTVIMHVKHHAPTDASIDIKAKSKAQAEKR